MASSHSLAVTLKNFQPRQFRQDWDQKPMVYNKEKWIAALKKAIVDTKHENQPTAGKPTAIATIRYLRDGLLDDVGDDDEIIETVKDCFNELIKAISKDGPSDGFASNASAAAKAAGYKTTAQVPTELVD